MGYFDDICTSDTVNFLWEHVLDRPTAVRQCGILINEALNRRYVELSSKRNRVSERIVENHDDDVGEALRMYADSLDKQISEMKKEHKVLKNRIVEAMNEASKHY